MAKCVAGRSTTRHGSRSSWLDSRSSAPCCRSSPPGAGHEDPAGPSHLCRAVVVDGLGLPARPLRATVTQLLISIGCSLLTRVSISNNGGRGPRPRPSFKLVPPSRRVLRRDAGTQLHLNRRAPEPGARLYRTGVEQIVGTELAQLRHPNPADVPDTPPPMSTIEATPRWSISVRYAVHSDCTRAGGRPWSMLRNGFTSPSQEVSLSAGASPVSAPFQGQVLAGNEEI
jgi:hypothetical protein